MKKIKVAILGYGNLGKSLEELILKNELFELIGIFSKRKNLKSKFNTSIFNLNNLQIYSNKIDIVFVCQGSYNGVENLSYKLIENFNFVDSFDTHKKLKNYIKRLDKKSKVYGKVCLCAFGWDPGLLSLFRLLFYAISGEKIFSNCFWGEGVSQGHSNAIRQIKGVKNAIQYTVPITKQIEKCRKEFNFFPSEFEKHLRICYVSTFDFANKIQIENEIKNMKNYFQGYETVVHFVNDEEVVKRQKSLSHRGLVISNYKILDKYNTKLEFSLDIQSNPYFTAQVMIMGAMAVSYLVKEKKFGAYSIFDLPTKYFVNFTKKDLNGFLL